MDRKQLSRTIFLLIKLLAYSNLLSGLQSQFNWADPKIDPGLTDIRKASQLKIFAACDIPVALFEASDGSEQCEAYK